MIAAETATATLGSALLQAIRSEGLSQRWLARQLGTDPTQVSRWVNNKAVPRAETVREIENKLGIDLSEAIQRPLPASEQSAPDYDLFVSAPINGLTRKEIEIHRGEVSKVVAATKEVVGKVYWPGEEVSSWSDFEAPDLATEAVFRALASCRAYLYLQFAQTVNPSGALVELGFALGRRIKTTMIIKRNIHTPYMFEGFQGVAAKLDSLPEAHIYVVDEINQAVRLIEVDGRRFLLSDETAAERRG
jgi:transcriptional regulator with XRE-family HTH domain